MTWLSPGSPDFHSAPLREPSTSPRAPRSRGSSDLPLVSFDAKFQIPVTSVRTIDKKRSDGQEPSGTTPTNLPSTAPGPRSWSVQSHHSDGSSRSDHPTIATATFAPEEALLRPQPALARSRTTGDQPFPATPPPAGHPPGHRTPLDSARRAPPWVGAARRARAPPEHESPPRAETRSQLRTNFDKTQLFRQSHIRPYTPI